MKKIDKKYREFLYIFHSVFPNVNIEPTTVHLSKTEYLNLGFNIQKFQLWSKV